MYAVDYAICINGFTGKTEECGDSGFFIQNEDNCFISHMDALGHNAESYRTVSAALEYLHDHYNLNLLDIVNGLHDYLKGFIGIVGFFGRLNTSSGLFEYCGIGNITARIFGYSKQTLVLKDGIIGYSDCRPRKNHINIFPGDIIVLTSDGIRENFMIENFPELLRGNAEDIATSFLHHLSKQDDDASCSVLRYLK